MFALLLSACSEERSTLESVAQAHHAGAPPYWQGGTGPAVHHLPVPWPVEPAPSECGATCGEWRAYTRFQNSLNDPRTKDPSNGGTSPQNHVNIASSCDDKTRPSIYYSLRKHPTDPSKDVLMFRWRVAQDAHTYATGPSPSSFRSGDAWSSALWTVLFNLDGSGYRTLAAHINGSSGSPSAPVDTLAGIYGKIPTQSINYLDDPDNIKLLGTQPTAFVDEGTGLLLNFQNSATPAPTWPNGSAETVWDYGTTRARLVSERPCNEYFIDYQIPVAMLDATSQGGPKVNRSTPISMLFCTANSLNNPFQKDCALNRNWTANTNAPGPFGDFISFDQDDPYAQPIISAVIAKAPSTCAETYALTAKVQDALWVNSQETIEPSVKAVSFWYYHDANGDGVSNDGSTWTQAVDASPVPGKLNEWRANWDSRGLPRGSYLIGAQAVDDNTRLDDGMVPSGVDNRTFSYVTSDSLGRVYVNGSWHIAVANFPGHSPAMAPRANENWYGNPLVTGAQVAGTGVDVALNSCGIAPSLGMTGVPSELTPGESVNLAITLSNPAQSPFPVNVTTLVGQLPPGFSYVSGSTSGPFGSANPVVSGSTLTWTFSTPVPVGAGASSTLAFVATASNVAGSYNAQASAATSFGNVSSEPVPLTVYAARASLSQTPSRYSVKPDGSTPVTYTLTYANESSVTLSNATLTNALPANVNYVACTGGSTCSFSGGQVTWQLGALAAGAKGSVTFTVNVAPAFTATSLTNVANLQATVPGGSQLQRSSTSTITVEQPVPAFSLTMTSSAVRIAPGTAVTWTLNYANQGSGVATGSFLVNRLPDGFTFTSCSVAGNPHFTGCTNSAGTVTFHGADGATGAGVTVGIGASGSVTLTATAAAAPFTFTNPAVNSATISASGGRGAAQAWSSVGVTGQYCNNVYYFRRGVDNNIGTIRPASALKPTDTAAYSTFISTTSSVFGTDQVVFRQEQPFAEDTTLSGLQLTIDFALGANQGGGRTRVLLENATTGQTIATSNDFSVSNSATPVWYQYTVTIPTPTAPAQPLKVLKGEQLRWVFQFRAGGGTRDITFYYDSVQQLSRSSFCAATSPASLTVSNTVDKTRIAGTVEKLTYTLRYANAGGTSASSVVLTDALAAGMTNCEYSTNGSTWLACSAAASSPQRHDFALGTLAAGVSGTVFVRGDSPASPVQGQNLVNTATLTSGQTSPVSATASTSLAGSNQPMLVITGDANKSFVGPGEVVTYTFTVKNVGTGPATNVAVSNALPAATPWYEYVPGSITGGASRSVSGNTLSWTLANLAVDATATLTFQMATSATGLPNGQTARDDFATLSDSSYCTATSTPASCTSNTVTVMVDGKANLTLSSSATPASVAPGQIIDYTLTVGSVGSSTANAVVLRDSLPPYTRFVETVPAGSGSYDAVNNRVVFSIGDLASGQTAQRGFRVRVDGSLPGGETFLVNVASASASNAQLRTSTVQTSAVAEPKMGLVSTGPASLPGPAARLSASASNATTVQVNSAALLEVGGYLHLNGTVTQITDIVGTTVTVASPVSGSVGAPLWRSAAYTLSFANTGNATAESVVITSALPAGWLYVASQPAANTAPGVGTTGNVSWSLGSVAAGDSSSLQLVAIPTLTATLPSAVADSRSCTSGATPGCADSVTTTVGGLSARKRTSTPVVSVGASASYTITLENSLNTPVTGVSVTDVLPSGFRYRPGSSTPAPTSVQEGQPTWSALTVPAEGQLEITFGVDVDALTGTGTYDNALTVVAPAGVGVTPFDALGTSAEDVTVVGASSFVAAGYVFRDRPALGTLDDGDTGLENVLVTINDGSGLAPYSLQTDGFGYFRRILPAGTWSVSIPSNQTLLNGMALYGTYSTPVQINASNPAASSIRFGYVPTAEATYTVSTQVAGGQGSFSPGSATVAHGGTTSFTVTPATGYSVQSVTGCGGSLVGNTYTIGAITSACTVTATFVLNQYTVSTQVAGGQGSFSPGNATVAHGDTTSFTVTPAAGYSVQSVTGCGGSLVGSTYTTAAVMGDCTVTATFALNQYTVSTQVAGGQGSFSPGSATVAHGDTTSFTVTPATGYSVQSVTGCGGSLVGNTYTTAAVMGDCTVTATFSLNQYTVSTQVAGGQGSFSPGNATVAHGGTTSFTVTPATGYSVQSVTGCGGSLVGNTYTTGAVTSACTVTASFVLGQYTVSTQVAGGQGSFSPGSATVAHGDTTSFTVTPAAGYSVQSVTGCGGSLSGTTYTTAVVTGDCTVTATFVLGQYIVSTQVAGGQGSFSPGSAAVAHGGTASFTVTPATGYSVQSVTGCGGSLVGTTYTTGAVTSDCTVSATFVLNQYTVSTQVAGGQGSFSPGSATVAHGDTTSFTVMPATGYSVQSVTGCGGSLVGNTYTTGAVTSDCTVTASFVLSANNPPTGVADAFSVLAGSPATPLDVLANDTSDPDTNETLTVEAVTQPAQGGTVSVAPNGTGVVFTPASGFTGVVTFTYTLSDGNGGTDTVTVTVNVSLVDSDNDGIDDDTEDELGLDPDDPDADDDGVLDSEDGLTDTDGDGLIDALDADSDNDGLNDGTERGVTTDMSLPGTDRSSPNFQPDSDPSTTTDPRNPDSDNDGLKDGAEDADHDGRLDDTESDPNDPDSDDGGETDGAEASFGGNPRDYSDDLAVAGRGCTSTGIGMLIPLALLCTLPLLRRRQARRGALGAWGLLGLLVTVLVAAPASAQSPSIPVSQGIDVQQYKPGPGLRDVLGVHSSRVGRHMDWNLGLSFNYAKDPLNFLNPRTDTFVYELVKNQFTFDLMGSLALFDRFELGVAVPITSQGSGSGVSVAPLLSEGVNATGVGDLRLVPKAHLLSTDGGLHLGVVVPVLLPTSGGKSFLGRNGVAAFPRVLGEWTSKEGVRVLANVGLNLQPQEQFYNLNVGNELAYGLGTEVPFELGQHKLSAEATLVGAMGLTQSNTEERPLEVLGALKYRFSDAVAVHLGGGPGLTRGYGTPGFRLFAGLIWTEAERAAPARIEPPPPAAPVCPRGPEDKDGFQDEDGCADPDNDGDGLVDGADGCPNQPETKNGFQDSDGCPDQLPLPPPPVDTDGDGLTDERDRCPAVAEDKDGFEDKDGCPEPDNDKDSVADAADKCPFEPEVINGVEDEDGCPDKGKVKVRVEGQKIVILDKVYFATNKDVILPRSFGLLQQVAAVLRANPEISKVRVEGHTDSQSSDAFNRDLSQRRANNVRKRLVEKEGIAPGRLESVGYGEARPIDTNKTAKGRENNRRVEFIILEMEKLAP